MAPLVMNTIKAFQALRFPWRFNERSPFLLVPLASAFEEELVHLKEGFKYAADQTLEAIEQQDFATLQRVTEPQLFNELRDGIETVKRRGHSLQVVNPHASSYTYFYNERVITGAHLNRQLNQGEAQRIEVPVQLKSDKPRVPPENIEIYRGAAGHLILKLDVVYNSARKLVVVDEHGQLIIGEANKVPENHKFRFECFVEKDAGVLGRVSSRFNVLSHFLMNFGRSPISLDNWHITDLDDFLSGNPYFQTS